MNGTNKNEVDLLLRSLARGRKNAALQSGLASVDERAGAADHLDADELNSYAEGVVPDPARVRYTEHLADCAVCRSLVVGLTQAAGAASRLEVGEQKNESSLWQKLAALLSPSVLRYAVPALVLTIVIGIGLFALRQQSEKAFVAENRPQNVQPAPADSGTGLNPASEPAATVQTAPGARTAETIAEDKSKLQDKKLQANQTTTDSDSSLAKAAPAAGFKDAEEAGVETGKGEGAALRPGSAAQPKVAAPPPPVEAEKSANFVLDAPTKREDKERARDEIRNQSDDVHGPNRARNAPLSTTQRAVGGLASERGPSAMNRNSKNNEVQTRDVLGKRFTRDGAVWVDTDYASQATIKLSRGSEQFRALVADEPGIRTIAERLDGAIIVVWRGRAYRIQ
ncbi:MAG TPA: hypothetical protein VGW76_02450 [Pyrinomonadaceae bacterium]|nr:hypothetical protein [Pyrinomonadaceae bacterium]